MSICALSIVLIPAYASAAPMTTNFTGIDVRTTSNVDRKRAGSDPASLAIDGNLTNSTYLTLSDTVGTIYIYLDLGSAKHIEGLRVLKANNEYGSHTLVVSYTTGTGAFNDRTYTPVSDLSAGYQGTELPSFAAGGGISGNSIVKENGAQLSAYVYSTTFNPVNATAIRLTLTDDSTNTHLKVNELQAIIPEPTTAGMVGGLVSLTLRTRRRRRA